MTDLPDVTMPSAIQMRAAMGADLANAGAILAETRTSAPFARFEEPTDLALFRGLLEQARSFAVRANALLADQTFHRRDAE